MNEQKPCCSNKTKERSAKEYRDLINRLSRIEGQVRGVKRMVENDAYCTDILIQVSAINAALNSFNKVLLGNHIRTCVADDIRAGNEEKLDELVAEYDFIIERRGLGLMQGLELSINPKDVIANALDNGLILFSAGTNVIRMVPPLVITKADVDEMITKLKKSF